MQIPFEVEPPERKKNNFTSSDSIKSKNNAPSSTDKIKKPFSVTKLTRQIKLLLENEFRTLTVEGELSNLKKASSGHIYFVLKDNQSQIRCVMFRQFASITNFQPENGLDVTVKGQLSVYKQRGEYQIIISAMEPKGLGALQLAFDQLKTKLESEGLFEEKFKKRIPFLPRKIGILTSPTGAVIHDMITILEHRFKEIPILLFPVHVQGDVAVPSLIEGIKYMNIISDSQQIDVLILGRGGGSIEDLWAFNNEKLARTIFSSKIPIISAIGHETDFTISDFVSDLRAPTPSAAIELAVPQKKDLKYILEQKKIQLNKTLRQKILQLKEYFKITIKRLDSPISMISQNSQIVDDLDSLLNERKNHKMEIFQKYFERFSEKIFLLNPKRELNSHLESLKLLTKRLENSIIILHKEREEKIKQKLNLLDSLSPLSVIARGYSVTLDDKGKPLKSITETHPGEKLQVRIKDGTIQTKVISVKSKKHN